MAGLIFFWTNPGLPSVPAILAPVAVGTYLLRPEADGYRTAPEAEGTYLTRPQADGSLTNPEVA